MPPDSPLTEASSIPSEVPAGDEGGSGSVKGGAVGVEMALKAEVRPRRAVRDVGTGSSFSGCCVLEDGGY